MRGLGRWLAPFGGISAWLQRADQLLFDTQVRVIRAWRPVQIAGPGAEVIIVGIDDATLAKAGVPIALIHGELGQALDAISGAGARAVAVDLVLPERSFDRLVPGADAALIRGLSRAARRTHTVFVLEPDAGGHVRAPFAPFVAAVGTHGLVTAQLPVDSDGVVRRYDPGLSAPGLRTLAGELSYRLGRGLEAAAPGWIDYTRGSAFSYVPLIEVLQAAQAGHDQQLRDAFEDRVVLIGSVLPYVDRVAQPVLLLAWEYPQTAPPAVVIHAQVLRSILGSGLIHAPPGWLSALAALVLACIACVPQVGTRWAVLGSAAATGVSVATLLHGLGWWVGLAGPLTAGVSAVALRTSLDVASARQERSRLTRTFGGYVSPQVFEAIVQGRLTTGMGRRELAFVFADLRGFTAWSEATAPEQVFEVLNRYFAAVTPSIHQRGGTIDNFRGDGIMALFGAPEVHSDACRAAFDAAREIVVQGRQLLDGIGGERSAMLDVAVGIAFGEAMYGDLGSADRKDFTAIGDAANVAARLQDLSKSLGYPVLMTQAVLQRLGPLASPDLAPQVLGQVALRGHSTVTIAGWRPAA